MLTKTFFVIASAALALANPVPPKPKGPGCPSKQQPVLPVTGGTKELPAIPAGATLKAIALGFGIQNYTCASSDPAEKAAATGAVAMLYDITSLYPGQGPKSLTLQAFNDLTTTAIKNHKVPLNFDPSTEGRISGSKGASATKPFTANAPLKLKGLDPIPFTGHHYFNAEGKPAFDVKKGNIKYIADKKESVDAPAGVDKGPEGTGTVGWLYLTPFTGTTGASHLYRVLTVGGVSHGCATGPGQDSVSYTATYWFYG